MSCLSIFSASAFGIISFVTKAEKEICASAKAAIVDPAACSGLVKSSSSGIKQLPCRLAGGSPQSPFALQRTDSAAICHGGNQPVTSRLLRAHNERRCDYRAAKCDNEFSPSHHSITSSARASSV